MFIRLLDEEAAQALRRDVLGDIGRIATGARRGDGVVVDIGGEDLEIPRLRAGDGVVVVVVVDGGYFLSVGVSLAGDCPTESLTAQM